MSGCGLLTAKSSVGKAADGFLLHLHPRETHGLMEGGDLERALHQVVTFRFSVGENCVKSICVRNRELVILCVHDTVLIHILSRVRIYQLLRQDNMAGSLQMVQVVSTSETS